MPETNSRQKVSDLDIMNAKQKSSKTTKCAGCGANMLYDPDSGLLKCEHCGCSQAIVSRVAYEVPIAELTKSVTNWSDETSVVKCNNCGAKEVISKQDISKQCSFCGTTNVVVVEELSGIKPNSVVPFRVGRESACEKVVNWVKRKFYTPGRFKRDVYPEKIHGVYNPAFTFDAYTMSEYVGRLGRTETYTVQTKNGVQTRTRTVYFNIRGSVNRAHDEVLVQASDNINQKDINNLQPFDTNNSKEYNSSYMQGIKANQYSKNGMQCWSEARVMMEDAIKRAILSKYTYSVIDYLNVSTTFTDVKFRYVLLPIYVGHNTYKKKLYNFFVNGFNGKVTGKTPISGFKVFMTVLGGLALCAGIGLLVLYMCM